MHVWEFKTLVLFSVGITFTASPRPAGCAPQSRRFRLCFSNIWSICFAQVCCAWSSTVLSTGFLYFSKQKPAHSQHVPSLLFITFGVVTALSLNNTRILLQRFLNIINGDSIDLTTPGHFPRYSMIRLVKNLCLPLYTFAN